MLSEAADTQWERRPERETKAHLPTSRPSKARSAILHATGWCGRVIDCPVKLPG